MKKTVFGCLGAAAVVLALQFTPANVHAAGLFGSCLPCDQVDPCDPCGDNGCNPCDAVCGTKAGKWFLNGHVEAGFFANAHGNTNQYYPWSLVGRRNYVNPGNSARNWQLGQPYLQNTALTGGQINQVYLSMGKAVDGRRGLDIGGTVDFTWGSDAWKVQSKGMEYNAGHGAPSDFSNGGDSWGTGDYYAAFAQAYAEIAYKRWNVKIGKFTAPFGSNPYKSTENFFYSWSTSALIAPHTAGGAYATYKVSDSLSVLGGWAMPEEIGESSKHNDVIGGIIWDPTSRVNVFYAFAAGTNKYDPYGYVGEVDEFVHSLVVTTQMTKRVKYVFDWTLRNISQKGSYHSADYALNNEIIYQYNKKWAFGTRFGMLDSRSGSYGYHSEEELYTVGVGANWTPNKWLIVKPEVRYDWVKDATTLPFNDSTNSYQLSGGLSAVVKF